LRGIAKEVSVKKAKLKELRSLSIAQPWAECIVSKGKNIENRSWDTRIRGYIAIHASGSYSPVRFEYCYEDYRIKIDPDAVYYGAIVGFAEIVDVVTKKELTSKTKKWFQGDYGFVLKNVIKLKNPVPVKGGLSFWKLKGATLKKCLDQLSATQRKKILMNPAMPVDHD